ncbi:hypothetical protein ACLOJK_040365 [Asimina triloba]
MEVENKYVTIRHCIDGSPSETDFEMKTAILPLKVDEGSQDVILKNILVSIDPYQLNRMKNYSSSQLTAAFATRISAGEVVDAYGIGRVMVSDHPEYAKDDIVVGLIGWTEYSVVKGGVWLRKINAAQFPLSYHVGILGFSGITAYGGFYHVCKPKKGEKVFVSAASGSVGNIVGQFAKLFGCYVVGCAGSNEKSDEVDEAMIGNDGNCSREHCSTGILSNTITSHVLMSKSSEFQVAILKDKLGFDDAFNYKKESDLKSTLKRYFPEGIDIYFDNVGGEMLEAAVANMNTFGRAAICGVISEYTDAGRRAAPDMLDVVYKRITIQGFLAADYLHEMAEFLKITSEHLRSGKMHALEDISQGLESVPSAFAGLFLGHNFGKKMVRVSDD